MILAFKMAESVRGKVGRGEMLKQLLLEGSKAIPPREVPKEVVSGRRDLHEQSPRPGCDPAEEVSTYKVFFCKLGH